MATACFHTCAKIKITEELNAVNKLYIYIHTYIYIYIYIYIYTHTHTYTYMRELGFSQRCFEDLSLLGRYSVSAGKYRRLRRK